MKYRRLTLEELKPLENEFIDFLVVNGVIADDWEQLLVNDVEKSNQIIDAFSEVVFEGIMRKTQFLEYRSKGELITFSCMADLIYMAGIRLDTHGAFKIDFNDEFSIKRAEKSLNKCLYMVTRGLRTKYELNLHSITASPDSQ